MDSLKLHALDQDLFNEPPAPLSLLNSPERRVVAEVEPKPKVASVVISAKRYQCPVLQCKEKNVGTKSNPENLRTHWKESHLAMILLAACPVKDCSYVSKRKADIWKHLSKDQPLYFSGMSDVKAYRETAAPLIQLKPTEILWLLESTSSWNTCSW